jgi:hypothetical protein
VTVNYRKAGSGLHADEVRVRARRRRSRGNAVVGRASGTDALLRATRPAPQTPRRTLSFLTEGVHRRDPHARSVGTVHAASDTSSMTDTPSTMPSPRRRERSGRSPSARGTRNTALPRTAGRAARPRRSARRSRGDVTGNAPSIGAERHADADLTGPLGHDQRQDRVQADAARLSSTPTRRAAPRTKALRRYQSPSNISSSGIGIAMTALGSTAWPTHVLGARGPPGLRVPRWPVAPG